MTGTYTTSKNRVSSPSRCRHTSSLRAAKGREGVDGPDSRQRRASVVEKLMITVGSAKVCVSFNTRLVVEPCDGIRQEIRLLISASLRLKLRGWELAGAALNLPTGAIDYDTYLSNPHRAITSDFAHVGDEVFEVLQKGGRVVLQHPELSKRTTRKRTSWRKG